VNEMITQKIKVLPLGLLIIFLYLVVLFADLMPMPLGNYATQRYLLLAFLGLVVVFLLIFLIRNEGLLIVKRLWPALLVSVSFIILALPFNAAPFNWVEPGMYALFFLGFVLAGRFLKTVLKKEILVTGFVGISAVLAAFYGGITISVYLFAMSDGVTDLSAYIPWGFVNIRYWSHIATWLLSLLPLAVLIGPLKDQRLWRFFIALGAALWWWIVFLSSSRGTMLGVAFGVLLAALFIGRPSLPWLKVFARYLVYGAIAWLLLSVLIPYLLIDDVRIRSIKLHSSIRMFQLGETWRMSLVDLPFGMGPQSWLTHDIITEDYRQSPKFGHPHNMYLMWAAEYGWLVVGAILVLAGQAIRLFWRRKNELVAGDGSALPLAAFTASVSAALLHAGVSAVFIAPGSMLIGFLVLSVFWMLISDDIPVPQNKLKTKRTMPALAVALVASVLCFFWLSQVQAYHAAMVNDKAFYSKNVPNGSLPRFWTHGNYPRHQSQMPQDGSIVEMHNEYPY